MRFLHLSDIHIGAWNHPKLSELPSRYFAQAIDFALKKKVDFVLIAGDLFNTALPKIDYLKDAVKTLQKLKSSDIPVYIIAGSHDFSPTNKSMLDVLEEAKLVINVCTPVLHEEKLRLDVAVDKKTGAKIVGLIGKRNMLDQKDYGILDLEYLKEQIKDSFSIFMFHTDVIKHKDLLPKGFSYYAGGHVHEPGRIDLVGYKDVFYAGPLFPTDFSELESIGKGHMVYYDDGKVESINLDDIAVKSIAIDGKFTSEEFFTKAKETIMSSDLKDKIVLLRFKGTVLDGVTSDIDFKSLIMLCYEKDAYVVLRNSLLLTSDKIEEVEQEHSVKDIEDKVLTDFSGKILSPFEDEVGIAKELLKVLSKPKLEGETKTHYQERVIDEALIVQGLRKK